MPNSNNLSIEIISAGLQGERTPLLLIHGAYSAAWCWQPNWLPFLAERGHPVFALSLRGHGLSGGHADIAAWRIDDYVADVRRVAEQIQRETGREPLLVGHSMGAFVALQYARAHTCAGLALIAPVPPEGLMGSTLHLFWHQPALLWELNLVQGGLPPKLDNLRALLFSPELPEALLQGYGLRFQHESERAIIDMNLPQFDFSPLRGSPPVLVLGSENDALIPPHLVHSAARFFGVRAQMIGGIGHLMMLDARWALPAGLLADWLERQP